MAIIRIYDVEFLDVTKDVKPGDVMMVWDEFNKNAKFPQSFLVGTVLLKNEEKRLLSLNKTSYVTISEVYGKDTKDWINKSIVYKGMKKMGAMQGKLFDAVR